MAQDPVKVDSGHYKVELENDKVRVLRIKYGPHEKSVMHGHPATVGVFLTDAQFRFSYPNRPTEEGGVKAGQVMYFDAHEHLPENSGDQPFEVIAVELKAKPAAAVKRTVSVRAKAKPAARKAAKGKKARAKPAKSKKKRR
jgi:cell envelope opacity-associated protein A